MTESVVPELLYDQKGPETAFRPPKENVTAEVNHAELHVLGGSLRVTPKKKYVHDQNIWPETTSSYCTTDRMGNRPHRKQLGPADM